MFVFLGGAYIADHLTAYVPSEVASPGVRGVRTPPPFLLGQFLRSVQIRGVFVRGGGAYYVLSIIL